LLIQAFVVLVLFLLIPDPRYDPGNRYFHFPLLAWGRSIPSNHQLAPYLKQARVSVASHSQSEGETEDWWMKAQWSAWEEREAESAMVTAVALCPAGRVASGSSVERHHG